MILLILQFFKTEWKYLAILGALGGLYYAIYTHGYHSCEQDIYLAKQKATEKAQSIAEEEKQKILQDNKQEIQKHLTLEKELTNELNKKKYSNCVVDDNVVRLLNKFAK